MMRRVFAWGLVAGLAWGACAWPKTAGGDDGTLVKVIQLKNRQAADLVRALQALVGPGGTVLAVDSRLVVRATPEGHARIEEALRVLDIPLRSLVITVSQARSRATRQDTSAVAASGTATEQDSRTVVRGAFGASSDDETNADVQRVAALEGYPALIHIGRSEPVATIGLLPTPKGLGVIVPGTAYVDAGTGFYVLARLDAHRVTLELWVERTEGAGGGAVAGQSLRTTMGGSLGQWMEVGSALREAEVRARALLGGGAQSSVEERSVRVRVDEVP
jgi:hypothetical protein